MNRYNKRNIVILLIIIIMLFSGCSIFGEDNVFMYYTPTPTPNKEDGSIIKNTPDPLQQDKKPVADIPEGSLNELIEKHIPEKSNQAILVTVDGKTQNLYCIDMMDYGWRVAHGPFKCNIGKKGLGKEKEGDGKSPQGVYKLGSAFGYGGAPRNMNWPWRETTDKDYWVEDNKSQYYNQYVNIDNVEKDWKKATKLEVLKYRRALEIKYNPNNNKDLGSAIFLHVWKDSNTKTSGCTSASVTTIDTVLRWLDPDKNPVLMQYEYANPLPKGYCYIKDFAPEVMYDIKFAGDDNILGKKSDDYDKAVGISTIKMTRSLNNASQLLKEKGYRLLVYDAYRPQPTGKLLVDWIHDEKDNATKEKYYPNIDKKDMLDMYFEEKSAYARGSAVDVSIVDRNGKELDMGTIYQFIDEKSAYGYDGLTDEQKKNRKLLHDTMVQAGLVANDTLWWSFYLKNEPFPDEYFGFHIK